MRAVFRKLVVAALWIAIWELLYCLVSHEILLPSPLSTARALVHLASTADFYRSVAFSLGRIAAGIILGIAAGTILAVLCSFSKWFSAFTAPLMAVIKATPVASFIILAMVWININGIPVFTSMLMVLTVVWSNLLSGIKKTDKNLIIMTRAFKMKKTTVIRRLYMPSVRPYFLAAMSSCMGMAWKAGIAAEVIAALRYSMGGGLYRSKIYLDTPSLFAWTAAVVILSIVIEKTVMAVMARGEKLL